jgi:hypothetical protein
VKAWVDGVPFEAAAAEQVARVAALPFIHKHIAVMPDVHWGLGATAAPAPAAAGPWLPIDTAPEGVEIMTRGTAGQEQRLSRRGWAWFKDGAYGSHEPTHWREL